ncbi:MAG TPA: hypothetical protein DHN29_05070, partial [Cytophagales bacterium]|nr:hypothetical protein [Cytophagales bacterium]
MFWWGKYCGILLIPGLTLHSVALAMPPDVSDEDWFAETVLHFEEKGYLPYSEAFRPGDEATRGEFIRLIVELLGGVKNGPFSEQEFDDVDQSNSLYDFFEEAGTLRLLKGDQSCYQNIRPCYAYPDRPINRAEAATLIMRAFNKASGDESPDFEDNEMGQWYWESIRSAASLCVLKGDTGENTVRPSDNMNRAEMIVMLRRIHSGLIYPDCGVSFEGNVLPDAPEPYHNANEENIQSPTETMAFYCTEEAWVCGVWSLCNPKQGIKTRTCQLVDFDCPAPDKVKPVERMGCVKGRTPDTMAEFVNYGNDLLKDMEATAYMVFTTYSKQIFDVMERYEKYLNEYAGITNKALLNRKWINLMEDHIVSLERQLEALEYEYLRIPKEYRRTTDTGYPDDLLPIPSSNTTVTCEDMK